jgi:oligoribonuclease
VFAIIDTETTSLDRGTCSLLEVAIVLTDDLLKVIDHISVVPQQARGWDAEMGDFVRDMHTKNGLIAAVEGAEFDMRQCEAALIMFLQRHGIEKGKVPVTGSSVAFDREVLRHRMPRLERAQDGWFHYRTIDVSTIKELCRAWLPNIAWPKASDDDKAHRALDDCYVTLEELRHYRAELFGKAGKLSRELQRVEL